MLQQPELSFPLADHPNLPPVSILTTGPPPGAFYVLPVTSNGVFTDRWVVSYLAAETTSYHFLFLNIPGTKYYSVVPWKQILRWSSCTG